MTRQDGFKAELFALLRKYDVEMTVEEDTSGWDSVVTGVNFFGYAKFDEGGNLVADSINLTLGPTVNWWDK